MGLLIIRCTLLYEAQWKGTEEVKGEVDCDLCHLLLVIVLSINFAHVLSSVREYSNILDFDLDLSNNFFVLYLCTSDSCNEC